MGYFPNSTAFDFYNAKYCQHCVNNTKKDDEYYMCIIQALHLEHNYDACNDDKHIIHKLIPRDGIKNKECSMFRVIDPDRCTETEDMFG